MVLDALLGEHGVEEILVLRSGAVGFLALHGGSSERRTEVIAEDAASRSGASLYAIVQPRGLQWHIPSEKHDPALAPRLRAFLDHVEVVISIHGYGHDAWWIARDAPRRVRPPDLQRCVDMQAFLVGGANRALADRIAEALRREVPDYPVLVGSDVPRGMAAQHPANPVNATRGGGAQVEVPAGARGLLPGRAPRVAEVCCALSAVAADLTKAA